MTSSFAAQMVGLHEWKFILQCCVHTFCSQVVVPLVVSAQGTTAGGSTSNTAACSASPGAHQLFVCPPM